MDENKSRVFGLFDRTTVSVVKNDIIPNRQSGHCVAVRIVFDRSARQDFLSMRQCINFPAWQQHGKKDHRVPTRSFYFCFCLPVLVRCLLIVCTDETDFSSVR